MQQGFEERYLDVLQNIEAAVISVYHHRPDLLDSQVDAALDALAKHYGAEQRGRTTPPAHLDAERREVYAAVREVCEWRLGRAGATPGEASPPVNSVDEIVACLKRVRKSVQRITKERGRQGYLQFISSFL